MNEELSEIYLYCEENENYFLGWGSAQTILFEVVSLCELRP